MWGVANLCGAHTLRNSRKRQSLDLIGGASVTRQLPRASRCQALNQKGGWQLQGGGWGVAGCGVNGARQGRDSLCQCDTLTQCAGRWITAGNSGWGAAGSSGWIATGSGG